jgi:hypothetical protein
MRAYLQEGLDSDAQHVGHVSGGGPGEIEELKQTSSGYMVQGGHKFLSVYAGGL